MPAGAEQPGGWWGQEGPGPGCLAWCSLAAPAQGRLGATGLSSSPLQPVQGPDLFCCRSYRASGMGAAGGPCGRAQGGGGAVGCGSGLRDTSMGDWGPGPSGKTHADELHVLFALRRRLTLRGPGGAHGLHCLDAAELRGPPRPAARAGRTRGRGRPRPEPEGAGGCKCQPPLRRRLSKRRRPVARTRPWGVSRRVTATEPHNPVPAAQKSNPASDSRGGYWDRQAPPPRRGSLAMCLPLAFEAPAR